MNIYVPFQLPKTFFCFLRLKFFGGREGFRVSTWFLSWDILLEPLHPGLIPPGTHHHGHYHRRCSPRRRQRPRRQGCAWRCWEPPGWRRRCGRNRWRAWRTDASAYPGRQNAECWGWGEKKTLILSSVGIVVFSFPWRGGWNFSKNKTSFRSSRLIWVECLERLILMSFLFFSLIIHQPKGTKGPTMNAMKSMMRRQVSKVNYWLSEYAPETLRWENVGFERKCDHHILSDKTKLVTLFLLFFCLISFETAKHEQKHVSSVLTSSDRVVVKGFASM